MGKKNSAESAQDIKDNQETFRLHFISQLESAKNELGISLDKPVSCHTTWKEIDELIYEIWKEIRERDGAENADQALADIFNFPAYADVRICVESGIELEGRPKETAKLSDDATLEIETFAGIRRSETKGVLLALNSKENLLRGCINQLRIQNIPIADGADWRQVLEALRDHMIEQLKTNRATLETLGVEMPDNPDWNELFLWCSKLYLAVSADELSGNITKKPEGKTFLKKFHSRIANLKDHYQTKLIEGLTGQNLMQAEAERAMDQTCKKMDKILGFPYEILEEIIACFNINR